MKSKQEGKLHYYPQSDVLHYLVAEGEELSSREVAPGVTLELDEHGKLNAATVRESRSGYGKKK